MRHLDGFVQKDSLLRSLSTLADTAELAADTWEH